MCYLHLLYQSINIFYLNTDDKHRNVGVEEVTESDKLKDVTFSNIHLHQSLSVTESCASWEESFQGSQNHSPNVSRPDGKSTQPGVIYSGEPSAVTESPYQIINDVVQKKLKSGANKLVHSRRGENTKLKAIFGFIAGLVVGGLLYVILVYSFGYSYVNAAIIFGVSTLIFCICLALSSLCRCIMALMSPNFFTGKGRVVVLSVILGILLTGPIANITHNARESGHSMACIVDLIRNQTLVLERRLAEPLLQMTEHVEKQKQALQALTLNMDSIIEKTKSQLNKIDSTISAGTSLLDIAYEVDLIVCTYTAKVLKQAEYT